MKETGTKRNIKQTGNKRIDESNTLILDLATKNKNKITVNKILITNKTDEINNQLTNTMDNHIETTKNRTNANLQKDNNNNNKKNYFFILLINMAVIESSTETLCRSLGNPRHFQILRLTVDCLKTKLNDPSFLKLIQKYDIMILKKTLRADILKITN